MKSQKISKIGQNSAPDRQEDRDNISLERTSTSKLAKLKREVAGLFKALLFGCLIILLLEQFGGKGLLGFIIVAGVFGLYRAWKQRSQILNIIKYIETLKWGKPLDKDMWKEGEFKKVKRK